MAIYETYAQVYDQSGQIQFSILTLGSLKSRQVSRIVVSSQHE